MQLPHPLLASLPIKLECPCYVCEHTTSAAVDAAHKMLHVLRWTGHCEHTTSAAVDAAVSDFFSSFFQDYFGYLLTTFNPTVVPSGYVQVVTVHEKRISNEPLLLSLRMNLTGPWASGVGCLITYRHPCRNYTLQGLGKRNWKNKPYKSLTAALKGIGIKNPLPLAQLTLLEYPTTACAVRALLQVLQQENNPA